MKPTRIQRKRAKGWRKPENTVCVSRPGKWGNPWAVVRTKDHWGWEVVFSPTGEVCAKTQTTDKRAAAMLAVGMFRLSMSQTTSALLREVCRRDLGGKNLACWCKPGDPCHADVLLEIANEGGGS